MTGEHFRMFAKEIRTALKLAAYGECGGCLAHRNEDGHPGRVPHACPYRSEIHDDAESLCNCCEDCTRECAMDI